MGLVVGGPVEFEEQPVQVHDFRQTADHFRGIYRMYLRSLKEFVKISTYNRLDLDTLEF